MELGAGFFRQVARPRRLRVGNRHELYGGVLRRQSRAQPADAAGTDHGDSQVLAFDGGFPLAPF
jgi:hypothetical protein